jgi:hypothetical protein
VGFYEFFRSWWLTEKDYRSERKKIPEPTVRDMDGCYTPPRFDGLSTVPYAQYRRPSYRYELLDDFCTMRLTWPDGLVLEMSEVDLATLPQWELEDEQLRIRAEREKDPRDAPTV